jgi:murein DD-endopeptidase MepM/ murein hydrolase activator NlpD
LEPADPSREFSVASSGTALFGDKQPEPDLAYRYAFPFGGSEPRRLEQGVGGRATHTGLHHYAFDFVMPIGTPVLAARGGLVLSVKDGFPEGRLQETYRDRANQVTVLHPDGTLGMYGHLSTGIPVAEGERVETGDTLGRSGNSGYSKGPHLHFEVGSQRAGGPPQSIPVVFGDGIVPVEGESYGPQ